MSTPALITLLLTLAAAALLITERLRPDLVGLLVLVVLGLSGVVRPEQVFAGFSGSAVMTLLAISILSIGLQQTGVTRMLGEWMYRAGRGNETRLMLVSLLTAAGLSLFMNNIAAVGILLPAVMSLSRLSRVSPSRLLMPLAFGTVLGGMATLLTTGNIVVSGALRDAGYAGFGLLEFAPIGLPIVAVGAVYMATAGRKLLSSTIARTDSTALQAHHEELTALYGLNEHSCLVRVLPDCPICGQTLSNGQWATRTGLNIMAILRGADTILAPSVHEVIVAGDILLSHCSPLDSFGGVSGLEWVEAQNGIPELADTLHSMAEVVIAPHTTRAGRTLTDMRFREKHHLNVLAVWRDGQSIRSNLSDLPLKAGDALLVQGPAVSIHLLENEPDLILLKEDPDRVLRPGKSLVALGITLLTLLIGVLEFFPIPVVMFAGAVMMLLTQCININEVYRAIEWRVLFLIAGMWPLSTAIRETGLAQAGIDALLGWVGPVAPLAAAALLILVALLLTQVMSSQVASLVLAPLAITAAIPLGADPRALGMAVALGCSLAFPTPYGHPVNLMVMNPGGYRFRDFTRVGLPLTVLVFATILLGLHLFWGLSF